MINNSEVSTILADEWIECEEADARIVVYDNGFHSAIANVVDGVVVSVTGKNGHGVVTTTSLDGTGYNNPKFYE